MAYLDFNTLKCLFPDFSDCLSDKSLWKKCLEPDDVSWHLALFSVLLVMGLVCHADRERPARSSVRRIYIYVYIYMKTEC